MGSAELLKNYPEIGPNSQLRTKPTQTPRGVRYEQGIWTTPASLRVDTTTLRHAARGGSVRNVLVRPLPVGNDSQTLRRGHDLESVGGAKHAASQSNESRAHHDLPSGQFEKSCCRGVSWESFRSVASLLFSVSLP